MQKYFEFGIYWDLLLAILLIIFSCFEQSAVNKLVLFQSTASLDGFIVSLITISATLLGFLLTIITVIVTFKKGFEDKPSNDGNTNPENVNGAGPVEEKKIASVFSKPITKEEKFYKSVIQQQVVNVFGNATYEMGIVLFLLLIIQFKIFNLTLYWIFVLSFCALTMIIFSVIRSLYIFKLFLRVHI